MVPLFWTEYIDGLAVTIALATTALGARVYRFIESRSDTTSQTFVRFTAMPLMVLVAFSAVFDLDIVLGAFAAGFALRCRDLTAGAGNARASCEQPRGHFVLAVSLRPILPRLHEPYRDLVHVPLLLGGRIRDDAVVEGAATPPSPVADPM